MGYKMDMSNESERHELELPDGWRQFTIIECREEQSKAGNDMFIFAFQDSETKQIGDVYAIATEGKRWFLKSILKACGVKASADGVYDWNIEEVLEKEVMGKVVNSEDTFINREGDKVTKMKSKVTEIKAV